MRHDKHIARFRGRLVPNGECMEWNGLRNRDGYGLAGTCSLPRLAHRRAWALFVGPIPDGMCVLHRCDNPPCCNPGHLFLGTQTDNQRDRHAKGRYATGESHWAKRMPHRIRRGFKTGRISGPTHPLWGRRFISDDQVSAIVRLDSEGASLRTIASEVGVSHTTARRIARGLVNHKQS